LLNEKFNMSAPISQPRPARTLIPENPG
jgi:hypothetical protein